MRVCRNDGRDVVRGRSLECGHKAQRAKFDADQLPESNGVFHVGPAAFCGSYGCISGQYAHFSGSRAFCRDRTEIALLAFEAMRGVR